MRRVAHDHEMLARPCWWRFASRLSNSSTMASISIWVVWLRMVSLADAHMVVDSACSSNSDNLGTAARPKASSNCCSWRRIVAHLQTLLDRPRASNSKISSTDRSLKADQSLGSEKLSLAMAHMLLARLCGSKLSMVSRATAATNSNKGCSDLWSWEKHHKLLAMCRGRFRPVSARNARTSQKVASQKLDAKSAKNYQTDMLKAKS